MDIQIEKKRIKKPIKWTLIVFVIGLVLAAFGNYLSSEEHTVRVLGDDLNITTVKQGEFEDYVIINGIVQAISTIYIDAYEGGRVKEKLIEEGSMVKKGDVILTLENRSLYEEILNSENNLALKQNDLRTTKLTFESRANQGKKELVQAEYELKRLKRNYLQQKELYQDELVSKENYLLAKENLELAEKQYQIIQEQALNDESLRKNSLVELERDLLRMKKTLSMIYERIDLLSVKSPVDGQLGFLDAELGQNIQQGSRIGQVNVLSKFKIEALVDEHYIHQVKRGLQASFQQEGQSYDLKLRKVFPEVREGKFKVEFVFEGNLPEGLRTGKNYKLRLQLGAAKESLLLSKGNFFQATGGYWVFVLDDNAKVATRRKISLGKQNVQFYEIIEGLKEGEKVIISTYANFAEASQLEIES